jgi:hypothetical protein
VQKFLATETAANAATKRAACNGNNSSMVTDVAATVSSESYCPSNDKDDSNFESSFNNSQYDDLTCHPSMTKEVISALGLRHHWKTWTSM